MKRNSRRERAVRRAAPPSTRRVSSLATRNASATDTAYHDDPEAMEQSDPNLAYYISHGDRNPDGST